MRARLPKFVLALALASVAALTGLAGPASVASAAAQNVPSHWYDAPAT